MIVAAVDGQPPVLTADCCDGVGDDPYLVTLEFFADEVGEVGVHCGEHLGELLDDGDVQTTGPQCFGHFESDVAGSDDEGGAWVAGEARGKGEGVRP